MLFTSLNAFSWRPTHPDHVLKQAAEKMKLFAAPVHLPPLKTLPTVIIPRILKARPLVTPPVAPAITFPLPTYLPKPPAPSMQVPVTPPVSPAETTNGLFAAAIPAAKAAIDGLTLNRRIALGLFFIGLLGLTWWTKGTKFRNVDISVEADHKQKRTYVIKLGKENRTTTIKLILAPGKPIEITINRPIPGEPTVYNIEINAAACGKKERVEVIDLGHQQVMRVVDRRAS